MAWQCTSGGPIWWELPAVDNATLPNPVDVAREAIAQMALHAIAIGIAPKDTPGSIGLVGAPVWMWAANPGPQTTGPQTATATDTGVTVTATATLTQVVWNMGDGHSVVCAGRNAAGTPFTGTTGWAMSPTCGYRYQTISYPGYFTVTATSTWSIAWQGGGQTGTIPLTLTQNTRVRIGELQVTVGN